MSEITEPVIHSNITDGLPEEHPKAFENVYCGAKRPHDCNTMLHCSNNECMTTWVEFAGVNVCAEVFAQYVLESEGVLHPSDFLEFCNPTQDLKS